MEHSGLLSTLSWIFNWKVPKVSHPRPMDVALNNYAHYTSGAHRKHFRKSSARNRKPWQNQRNKSNSQQKWSRRKRKHHQQLIQHRTSSSQNSSPYKFEQPLQYYDASQVYYYPSHKNWTTITIYRKSNPLRAMQPFNFAFAWIVCRHSGHILLGGGTKLSIWCLEFGTPVTTVSLSWALFFCDPQILSSHMYDTFN